MSHFSYRPCPRQDDEFPPRDDFSDADQLRVGNDGIFMLAFFSKSVTCKHCSNSSWLFSSSFFAVKWQSVFVFVPLVAFLFNWIGFCLSFCLTNTIAGRYGAICGFGLSLIKWILIVRVRTRMFLHHVRRSAAAGTSFQQLRLFNTSMTSFYIFMS